MKTIILCGGSGTRLREETEFKPKPMVYVGNKPILWHIMKTYAHFGYNEFILALGYKADYIKEYFLNQKAFTSDFTLNAVDHKVTYHLDNRPEVDNFKITFVDTGLETKIGGRILKCQQYIPGTDKQFMVTYGDAVSDINIKDLVNFHKKQKTIGTVTGVHPTSKYGILAVDNNNLISGFYEKPVMSDWINGGFAVFNHDFFKYLREDEFEHPALRRLAKEKQLSIFKHEGFWYAVDTNKELKDLNELAKTGQIPWRVWL